METEHDYIGRLHGLAIPFGQRVRNYCPQTGREEWFLYHPRSFADTLYQDDVFLTVNHDDIRLATTEDGSLSLKVEKSGLFFAAWLRNDPAGHRARLAFACGEVRGISICGLSAEYERSLAGCFRVTCCRLTEISLAISTEPAASDTWVRYQSMEEIEAARRNILRAATWKP